MYCGEDGAREGETYFVETFQKGAVPEEVIEIEKEYIDGLLTSGVVASKTELRRLLEDGGVRDAETGEKLAEIPTLISSPITLRIGKRRFVRLVP
jgi:tyrosyl-tRNA synthetase